MRNPSYLLLGAAALTVAMAGAGAPAAAAAPTPPPRVATLHPRVVDLKVRVVDLKPQRSQHTYTVDSDVLFAFGSASLSRGAADVLDDVVTTLREERAKKVTVTGYTDAIGSTTSNQSLSERRAGTVSRYLRGKAPDPTYTARGRGESDPVAANQKADGSDDPDGRRKNRRVVITYTTG